MDREKLRQDMLRNLATGQHRISLGEVSIADVLTRLKLGLSDPAICPLCYYLHGKHATMREVNSPLGRTACGDCGYHDGRAPGPGEGVKPSILQRLFGIRKSNSCCLPGLEKGARG